MSQPGYKPLDAFASVESQRLLVRRVSREDLPALMAVNGDERVTRYLPYRAWTSTDDAQAWFDRMEGIQQDGNAVQLVVVDKASGGAIGTCLLFRFERTHRRAELGYVLAHAYWGRGYMREALQRVIGAAFGDHGVRRLEAEIDPANAGSRTLLQRLGFVREGLLRERFMERDGTCSDSELFGLLAREWDA